MSNQFGDENDTDQMLFDDDPQDRAPMTEAIDTIKKFKSENSALRERLARLVWAAKFMHKPNDCKIHSHYTPCLICEAIAAAEDVDP